MGILGSLWLILVGMIVSPDYFVSRMPNASPYLEKAKKWEKWFGVASAIIGLWALVFTILHFAWISTHPGLWLSNLAAAGTSIALGIVLAYETIQSWLPSKVKDKINNRLTDVHTRLAPHRTILGVVGMTVGCTHVVIYTLTPLP